MALLPPRLTPEEIQSLRLYAPNGTKFLRACLRCRIIMTKQQFFDRGCPNCADVLNMREQEGRVTACTTTAFQGFISLLRPGTFVSRFNGLEGKRLGCYALAVQGSLPDWILNEDYEAEEDFIEPAQPRQPEKFASSPRRSVASPAKEPEPAEAAATQEEEKDKRVKKGSDDEGSLNLDTEEIAGPTPIASPELATSPAEKPSPASRAASPAPSRGRSPASPRGRSSPRRGATSQRGTSPASRGTSPARATSPVGGPEGTEGTEEPPEKRARRTEPSPSSPILEPEPDTEFQQP